MKLLELHDIITKHLLTQGKRAIIELPEQNTVCLYRAPDGSKCAVGCIIPDELYDPEMEENSIRVLLTREPKLRTYFLKLLPDEHPMDIEDYLVRVQSIHDRGDTKNWEAKLAEVREDLLRYAP